MPVAKSRACDRCYSVKERCAWQRNEKECDRCRRLGFPCETRRPTKRVGRRPRFSIQQATSSASPNRPEISGMDTSGLMSLFRAPAANPALSEFQGLSSSDQRLVYKMMFSDDLMDNFLIGPSFRETHRRLLISQFFFSGNCIKDALLAVALSPTGQQDESAPDSNASYRHASTALRHLRTLKVENLQSISECLILGAMVLTFAYCSRVTDAPAISIQTLSLVKEAYESQKHALEPDDLVFMSCLIMPELLHCLLHGTVPTLRFQPPPLESEPCVDRYLGLCITILPYFHDLCELSNALSLADQDDLPEILLALDPIESAVKAWQPAMPKDLCSRFNSCEVAHLLAQVQAMRLGALLVIHRLRFPFGTNDEPAHVMAACILTQLETTYCATQKTVICVALPVLAACFEMRADEREMWYSRVPHLAGYSPSYADHVLSIISSFWVARDAFVTATWANMGNILAPLI